MRSLLRAALAGGLLLAVACGGQSGDAAPELEPAVTTAPAPRSTPASQPTTAVETPSVEAPLSELSLAEPAQPTVLPIEQLAPGVAAILDASAGRIGIAVSIPEQDVVYVGGESRPFALASAVKVPLMLAVLERAQSEGRELTAREEQQLQAMVTRSDNVSTTSLWGSLGRSEGVAAYLAHLDVPNLEWGAGNSWGDTTASPQALAELLASVLDGSALGVDEQAIALSLLENVVADQRWGVSAGLNLDEASGVRLGIKDGWYPLPDGWRLATTGIVRVEGGPSYTVAILSDQQPAFEEGVWTLERIAAEIHHALLPQAMTAELSLTEFPSAGEALVASEATPPAPTQTPGAAAASSPTPAATPTSPPSAVTFLPLEGAPDVLVPADAVPLAQERGDSVVSHWFEVPGESSASLLPEYLAAMEQAGWSLQSTAPQLTLTNSGRYVTVGVHDQPDQTVLNLIVSTPQVSASATFERE